MSLLSSPDLLLICGRRLGGVVPPKISTQAVARTNFLD